jgi:hypothetical protein
VEFYDMPGDPAEARDVAAAHPEVADRLARMALDCKATLPPGDVVPTRPRAARKAPPPPGPTTDRAAVFKGKDTDRDGVLTLEEYLRRFPDQAEGRRRFPTFDADGDGVLSEEEFVARGRP